MQISEAIRYEREARNLSRPKLAEVTGGSKHAIRAYEDGQTKPCRQWLARFEASLQTRNPVICEYLKRRDIRTATQAEISHLYETMSILAIAELYGVHWHTVRSRMDVLGIERRATRRDFRSAWWEITEGDEVYQILNLKAFASVNRLSYPHVLYKITKEGVYQNERFAIRKHDNPTTESVPDPIEGIVQAVVNRRGVEPDGDW
jgi:transcriptional regulator with XRE-family HTH domain